MGPDRGRGGGVGRSVITRDVDLAVPGGSDWKLTSTVTGLTILKVRGGSCRSSSGYEENKSVLKMRLNDHHALNKSMNIIFTWIPGARGAGVNRQMKMLVVDFARSLAGRQEPMVEVSLLLGED